MKLLKLSIIAKDHTAYEGEAMALIVPTKSGIIEVLPQHMQLVSALSSGELIIKNSNGDKTFKINGGVMEVKPGSQVIILSDRIEEVV